jgi:hypothetical protein
MDTLLSALHLPTPTSFSAVIIGRFALANAETSILAPLPRLPQLAGFLGTTDKLPAMRACIDPALYRVRKTGPAQGK